MQQMLRLRREQMNEQEIEKNLIDDIIHWIKRPITFDLEGSHVSPEETAEQIMINIKDAGYHLDPEQPDREAAADKIDDLLARCGVGAYCSVELRQQELETADKILALRPEMKVKSSAKQYGLAEWGKPQ